MAVDVPVDGAGKGRDDQGEHTGWHGDMSGGTQANPEGQRAGCFHGKTRGPDMSTWPTLAALFDEHGDADEPQAVAGPAEDHADQPTWNVTTRRHHQSRRTRST